MNSKPIFLGKTAIVKNNETVNGEYTCIENEDYYVIRNYTAMRPFFMTLVSASNHWLFISSSGGLTAGRKNPNSALFPYYSDDKVAESNQITGSKTVIKVEKEELIQLWEPFNEEHRKLYQIQSNLYKNREGSKLIFEEHNEDLGICFRYSWGFSEKYGIVKNAELINSSQEKLNVEVLDGIQNILPYGVQQELQNSRSTLVDAYKRAELDEASNIGIFALSSMIIDRAEPSEALKSSTVWTCGLDIQHILLSTLQLEAFRVGENIETEYDIKAEKGAYFVHSSFDLESKMKKEWLIIGEVDQSSVVIEQLKKTLTNTSNLLQLVKADVLQNKLDLRKKIGLSDGIQMSNDRLGSGRHFSNVLFNIMRGGTFDDIYDIDTADFRVHIKQMNKTAYAKLAPVLEALPSKLSYHQLRQFLLAAKQQSMMRYYLEYLPISFSRRHGDPSRPWNYFSIETKDNQGNKLKNFEGNWRDIFQNWEALAYSFPEYALGMIAKFVNASTIDGYNPYRISREGIDWEVIEENDPWSYIGYWGDHQVIYLCKLLEISNAYHPHRLIELLSRKIFTYAMVPYRIRGYDAIINNPSDTIDFDHQLADTVKKRVEKIGSDGKLVWNSKKQLLKVNLTEKLLVMTLTKLYNFIPEAGIWLNTQRPEWNDANNALVGNGVSMVTLYYLRRFLDLTISIYGEQQVEEFEVNKPVADLLSALRNGFKLYESKLQSTFSDEERRELMDIFGVAGEHYRTTAYGGFTGDKRTLRTQELIDFFRLAKQFLEHSIKANKRKDQLYHAYNLVELQEGTASINHLYEMLEGQVAVLSANFLDAKETSVVLNALKKSKMYREDQYSYLLYPHKNLDHFLNKNIIPSDAFNNSQLFVLLMSNKEYSIIEYDVKGILHFNSSFHNVNDLNTALSKLDFDVYGKLVKKERVLFEDVFEQVFKHQYFTGRSGSFYGYEGLGSIYWHMVSKLLLSIQENIRNNPQIDKAIKGNLIEHYYEIRAGIGVDKSPELYGAFPTDPYSHTPKYGGVKQPGMTGQVKEDVINRWAELGIEVEKGQLRFLPSILRRSEFLTTQGSLSYYDFEQQQKKLIINEDELGFTYCQIPIVYRISTESIVCINYDDGSIHHQKERTLGPLDSKDVFKRTGKIVKIEVGILKEELI